MLSRLKKALGRGCDFLSFSTDKILNEDGSWTEVDCVKAKMKNDSKGQDTVVLVLDKKPIELTE